jgi:hypothetical protein
MELLLERRLLGPEVTIGQLFVDGWFECFTLEDTVRDIKIAGQTAIPTGKYEIIINNSKKFKKDLIQLLDVPGFTGIRIHAGNTATDTEGCILVGKVRALNMILESNAALNNLQPKVQAALNSNEKVWITIKEVQ